LHDQEPEVGSRETEQKAKGKRQKAKGKRQKAKGNTTCRAEFEQNRDAQD
jgi:uncharacterized protein YjbJ (UPF0337 family)